MDPIPTGEYARQPHQPYPTQAEFLEKLTYDPLTGEIRWRKGTVRADYRNPVSLGPDGVPSIRWGKRLFGAIRVAYILNGGSLAGSSSVVLPKDRDPLNFKADNFRAGEDLPTRRRLRKKLLAEPTKQYNAWVTKRLEDRARRKEANAHMPRFNDPRPASKTKAKPLPPVEVLRAMFSYHPEVGLLRWKADPEPHRNSHGKFPGTVAGSPNSQGYLRVRVGSRVLMVHRIIWAIHHGEDPGLRLIDHIDHDPSNNRIENLRKANHAQNSHNLQRKTTGLSGVKGVHWITPMKKWKAQFTTGGHRHVCGYFDTVEAAAAAVKAARTTLHGEFARHA